MKVSLQNGLFLFTHCWRDQLVDNYIYIYIYIYTHTYIHTQASHHEQEVTRSIFLSRIKQVQIQFFHLLHWLPYQGQRAQSAQQFTHSWREDSWIYTFPKGISAMGNVNKLEHGSPCSFPMMITITSCAPYNYV